MLISMRGTAMVFCLALGLAGCDATRELVKAPFDATTAVSNGTTQVRQSSRSRRRNSHPAPRLAHGLETTIS